MNKVFIAGNLAADPQPFVTQTGKLISNISVACRDNMNKNEVYFFPCVAWQSNAKFINTYLKKGDSVIVDGKLVRRSYVSKEGKNVYITEIVIDSIKPFGSRRQNDNSSDINETQNSNYNNNQNYQQNTNVSFEKENYGNKINDNFSESNVNQSTSSIYSNQSEVEDDFNDVVDLDWLDEIDK